MLCTLFSSCVELEACKTSTLVRVAEAPPGVATRHTQPAHRRVTFDLPLPVEVSDTPMRTQFARVFSFGCTTNQLRTSVNNPCSL